MEIFEGKIMWWIVKLFKYRYVYVVYCYIVIFILLVIMCILKILQDLYKKFIFEKIIFINDYINVSKKIEMVVNCLYVYS